MYDIFIIVIQINYMEAKNIIYDSKIIVEKIDNYMKIMKENKKRIEMDFNENLFLLKKNEYLIDNNIFKVNEYKFESLFDIIYNFLKKQRDFIEKVSNLYHLDNNSKLNKYMSELFTQFVYDAKENYSIDLYINDFINIPYKIDLEERYSSIFLLEKFSEYEEDIVLIGGNGSGKSSLANCLKGDDMNSISVIPAQKNLYYSITDVNILKTEKTEMENMLLENNIRKGKSKDYSYDYFNYHNNQFTKLIMGMQSEYTNYLYECDKNFVLPEREETIFGKLKSIFKIIFPNIDLEFEGAPNFFLNCKKDGSYYQVNSLSEGEKVVIYYSISILLAKKNSFIIVDEPETYMNPSLTNILWDTLTEIRSDCQFIFITHSINFVLGRTGAKIAWIKKYNYPNNWEFEFLEEDNTLPKNLLTDILGSPKPVLFCEGDDKSSLDYHIYKAIFGENYSIIPVNGHRQVIDYCRSVNRLGKTEVAYGLIDGDNIGIDKKDEYKKDNIFFIPFNEIEMLLIEDNVMEKVMKNLYPLQFKNKIEEFKIEVWEKVKSKKETIILDYVKKNADEFIEREKIDSIDNLYSIKNSLRKISNYNIDEIYIDNKEKLENIIEKKDYFELLKICNLKKELTKGIANKLLDNNYEEKVKQQIITNYDLKKYIKEKYFSFL